MPVETSVQKSKSDDDVCSSLTVMDDEDEENELVGIAGAYDEGRDDPLRKALGSG